MIFMVVAGAIRHNLVIHLVFPRIDKKTRTARDDLYTAQEVD